MYKMEVKIIRSKDLQERDYGDTKVIDIFNEENYDNFSIAKVSKIGDDIKLGYDTESDVAYYVLEGQGICVINGEEHEIKKGDLVFLPRGTKYKNKKGLVLLAIASPKFDREKRKYLE